MKKIFLLIMICSFLFGLVGRPKKTQAVDTSLNSFTYGGAFNNLIANDTFIAKGSISVAGIQQFLELNNSYLKSFSENGRTAAQIIYDAAHGYGGATYSLNGIDINTTTGTISPKVILATLEKEQGLIASNLSPSQSTLDCAMGYEWGNGCSWMFVNKPGLKGFTNQVESAAWQLRYNYEAAQKDLYWWSSHYSSYYYIGLNTNIPNSTGGSYNVTMSNAATAALYRYTPYVLNGNYNFWKFYNIFFGNNLNMSVNPATLGSINVQGISCGDNCAISFPTGGNMTLTANNTYGSEFSSWDGCDSANGNVCTILFNNERSVKANFVQSLTSKMIYYSGTGNWNMTRNSDFVAGDFNGDGVDELAAMYNYGNGNMGIVVFTQNSDGSFSSRLTYATGPNNWNFERSKGLVAGNFGGDNKTDLAILYDYGNNNTGIWTFISDGNTFAPFLKYSSGPGNWNYDKSKYIVAGNFRGDDLDDIAIAYDYGNSTMGIWSLTTNLNLPSTPQLLYYSGIGNWDMDKSKGLVAGNFGGDSLTDLAFLYNYGNNNTSIWNFITNATLTSTPQLFYNSGPGNWNYDKSKSLIAGNFNGTSLDNIDIVYDYGDSTMRIWGINSQSSISPWYNSGPGNWDISKSKSFVVGKLNSKNRDNLLIAYDYGDNAMGLTNFVQTGHVFSNL